MGNYVKVGKYKNVRHLSDFLLSTSDLKMKINMGCSNWNLLPMYYTMNKDDIMILIGTRLILLYKIKYDQSIVGENERRMGSLGFDPPCTNYLTMD